MRWPKFWMWTMPRLFIPATATTSFSFGEPRVRISGPVAMAAADVFRKSRRVVVMGGLAKRKQTNHGLTRALHERTRTTDFSVLVRAVSVLVRDRQFI